MSTYSSVELLRSIQKLTVTNGVYPQIPRPYRYAHFRQFVFPLLAFLALVPATEDLSGILEVHS